MVENRNDNITTSTHNISNVGFYETQNPPIAFSSNFVDEIGHSRGITPSVVPSHEFPDLYLIQMASEEIGALK